METSQKLPDDFIKLSCELGKNPSYIQGAGGNTSIKLDDTLWVKASGKWLAYADKEETFIALDLNELKKSIKNEINSIRYKYRFSNDQSLRPSIETALHAIMRHKIVLHVHSLNTLAWAVQKNGKNKVEKCLKGLKWIWVPYTKPGIKLAELVRRNMNRETDIVILANHGLIIGGENCEKTKNLLEEVEARLKIPMRETQAFEEEKIKKYITTNYLRTPYYDEIHSISNDPTSFKIALRGPMYPDHLVFLGEKPKVIYKSETAIDSCLENCEIILKKNQCYVLIEGEGVLVDKNISQGAEEMLLCQALLLKRLKEDSDIVFLNKKQSLEIIDWDAEKFRRSLNCIPK